MPKTLAINKMYLLWTRGIVFHKEHRHWYILQTDGVSEIHWLHDCIIL